MKNFIRSLYEAVCIARLKKAQFEIAQHLWKNEYKHESFDYILTMVQSGRVSELGGSSI